jgi:hypothetical protein
VRLRDWLLPFALAMTLVGGASRAHGDPELYRDADHQLGAELLAQHQCHQCHTRRVGGDGSDIYNPQGRINNAAFLRGMVEQCNTELNLGLFPEEVTAVAAVLNRRHYKFTR